MKRRQVSAFICCVNDDISSLLTVSPKIITCQANPGPPFRHPAATFLPPTSRCHTCVERLSVPAMLQANENLAPTRLLSLICLGITLASIHAQTIPAPEWRTSFQAGTVAFKDGRLQDAAQAFALVTKADPKFPEGHFNLGLTDERLGRYPEAIMELRSALALKPSLRGASLFLGLSLYNVSDYTAARDALRHELTLDPNNVQALQYLGLCAIALDRPDEATTALDKAAKLDPQNIDVLYFNGHAHMMASKAAYDMMFKANPHSWRVHEVLGEAYAEADRTKDAIAEYQEAIRLAPSEPELHHALGLEYAKTTEIPKAIEAYKQELQIAPNSYQTMVNLGMLQVQSADPEGGVEVLTRALQGDTSLTSAYFYRALGEKNLSRFDKAEADLDKALETNQDPDLKQRSYYLLFQVYRALHEPEKAKAALATFTELKARSDQENNQNLAERMKRHEAATQPE